MYFCFTEELFRILQRYRSTGKRSHWKVWLRLNRSSRSDGKISRRVARAVGTEGTPGLTPRLWSDPCLQDVCTVISPTQTLPSDNTWKLPFSRCDCSRVPVDAPLTLFSQPGGFFRPLCVCRFLSPLIPFALLFLWFSDISVSLDKCSSYQKNIKNDSFPFSFLSTSVFCGLHLTIFCSGGPVCSQGRLSLCSRRILTRDSLMLTWNWSPFYIISMSPRLGLWSCRNYYGFSPIVPSSYIKEN